MDTYTNKRMESLKEVMNDCLSKAFDNGSKEAIESLRDTFLAMPECEFKKVIVVGILDEFLK